MVARSRTLRLLLALVLLFSQQQAVLHLLGHNLAQLAQSTADGSSAGRGTSQDPADPQESVCARCLAIAHLDHAVSGGVPAVDLAPTATEPAPAASVAHIDLAFFADYRSRAPPFVS